MRDIDKVLVILQKTNDGNDLTGQELYLCQEGVNGHLTEYGRDVLNTLYMEVINGSYTKKTEEG